MNLRNVDRDDFTEFYLTARSDPRLPAEEAFERLSAELAMVLAAHRVEVLQEKVYGPQWLAPRVTAIRRAHRADSGLDTDVPCSWITGRDTPDCALTGAQIYGVVPRPNRGVRVTTVETASGLRGRELVGPDCRMLLLSSIGGAGPDSTEPVDRCEHAKRMLARAEAALGEFGMSFAQVARTWIYLRDILAWYGAFNDVRTAFLNERGIGSSATARPFPASTGIQGSSGGEECVMDLCAIDAGPEAAVQPVLQSRRQGDAFAYGSSFSRATTLTLGGRTTVFVSGTASIDPMGHSLHPGDREAQILETMQCIDAVLDSAGGRLADVCSATVFGKDEETLRVFESLRGRLDLAQLPCVSMLADVCRPELLVEVEALAVIGAGSPS